MIMPPYEYASEITAGMDIPLDFYPVILGSLISKSNKLYNLF